MPEWKKGGNIVASSIAYLKETMDKDIPTVLVDLRPVDEAKKGFIANAMTINSAEIAGAKDRFPADKKAPVILYASDTASAIDAFRVVRGWGYTNASVLERGIEVWKKAGNPLATGELKTTIAYVPKPRPGEISVDEFKQIVETLPPDKVVLDIRDTDEAMQGMLKGAKNIPTQELAGRLSEVPKDREIVLHCNTGVRAEMAYNILKDAGFKVRFLNATIAIDKDGKYEITKE